MWYRVQSIDHDERSGLTVVEVWFWRTRPASAQANRRPLVRNEFYVNWDPAWEQERTDTLGRIRVGGEWVHPWREVDGEWRRRTDGESARFPFHRHLRAAIERFADRIDAKGYRGDQRDPRARKSDRDPLRVKQEAEVAAMVGPLRKVRRKGDRIRPGVDIAAGG